MKITNFPLFHWFSPRFQEIRLLKHTLNCAGSVDLCFKAKKVTLWEVFSLFLEFLLFRPKTAFSPKFLFWGGFSPVSTQNWCFPPLGFQKNAPDPYVFVGFHAGGPKVPFWDPKSDFGPQNQKKGWIAPKNALLGSWPPRGAWHYKNHKYFLRNTWCFDMPQIMKLSWMSWFRACQNIKYS